MLGAPVHTYVISEAVAFGLIVYSNIFPDQGTQLTAHQLSSAEQLILLPQFDH